MRIGVFKLACALLLFMGVSTIQADISAAGTTKAIGTFIIQGWNAPSAKMFVNDFSFAHSGSGQVKEMLPVCITHNSAGYYRLRIFGQVAPESSQKFLLYSGSNSIPFWVSFEDYIGSKVPMASNAWTNYIFRAPNISSAASVNDCSAADLAHLELTVGEPGRSYPGGHYASTLTVEVEEE